MILSARPQHLSTEDAAAWMRREATRLLEVDGVVQAELTPLRGGSGLEAREWAWMLELHLRDGADGRDCANSPVCQELVGDLRLLGMRPALLVADGPIDLDLSRG